MSNPKYFHANLMEFCCIVKMEHSLIKSQKRLLFLIFEEHVDQFISGILKSPTIHNEWKCLSAYLKRGVILFTNCSTLPDGGRYTMTSNIFLHLSGFSSHTRTSSLGSKSVRRSLGIFFLINTATPPPVTSPRASCLSRLKTVYVRDTVLTLFKIHNWYIVCLTFF